MHTRRIVAIGLLVLSALLASCGVADTPTAAPRGAASPAGTVAGASPTEGAAPTVTIVAVTATPNIAVASQTMVDATETATATSIVSADDACSAYISAALVAFDSAAALAWSSHQIVVGTVTETLPPRKVVNKDSILPFTIVTGYVVHVERQFRGQPTETVLVRSYGGTIGNCVQTFEGLEPRPATGARLLLFLREPDFSDNTQDYEVVGAGQGYWAIAADDTVSLPRSYLPYGSSAPLSDVEQMIADALAAGPPDDPIMHEFLVPLEDAPIATP